MTECVNEECVNVLESLWEGNIKPYTSSRDFIFWYAPFKCKVQGGNFGQINFKYITFINAIKSSMNCQVRQSLGGFAISAIIPGKGLCLAFFIYLVYIIQKKYFFYVQLLFFLLYRVFFLGKCQGKTLRNSCSYIQFQLFSNFFFVFFFRF